MSSKQFLKGGGKAFGIFIIVCILLAFVDPVLGNSSGWSGLIALVIFMFGSIPVFIVGGLISNAKEKQSGFQKSASNEKSEVPLNFAILSIVLDILGLASIMHPVGVVFSLFGIYCGKKQVKSKRGKLGHVGFWFGIANIIFVILFLIVDAIMFANRH